MSTYSFLFTESARILSLICPDRFVRGDHSTGNADSHLRAQPERFPTCLIRCFLYMEYVAVLGNPKHRAGILSFSVDRVHPYDLASFLDQYGIAVRTGSLCSQPVINHFGLQTVTRISPAFYNTPEELEQTSEIMRKVIRILRRS